MLKVVHDDPQPGDSAAARSLLDEIVRDGARQMLAAALRAEVAAYIEAHADQVDEHGRRLVVRNGFHDPREVATAAGAVPVRQPRVNDKRIDEATGERIRFSSAILPAWCRRSPQVAEVLPLLYLHGLSTGDFVPALEQFLGSAAGLSPTTVTRLTAQWQDDAAAFGKRSLAETDNVCLLVMIGVRVDGTKELVALADGFRESSESWAELLRDCKRRGMRAPVLAVGDGALGFWAAVRDVFPATRHQRDWVHKAANVLDALPASVQAAAKRALREIWDAEDRPHAEQALDAFVSDFAKWPKAVAKLTKEREAVLAFYDFPAEHWIHLRTSNPIESTFSPVRARTDVTKGPGSRAAGLAMCFKLIEAAEGRWRRVNAPELVALVRAGAKFVNGRLVERTDQEDAA